MLSEALGYPCHHISKISRTIVLRLKILSTWLATLVVIVLCPYEVHRGFKPTSPLSQPCRSVAYLLTLLRVTILKNKKVLQTLVG